MTCIVGLVSGGCVYIGGDSAATTAVSVEKKRKRMNKEQQFISVKREILRTPAYQGVPSFPDDVKRMRTLEELVWWLGATDFSSSPLGGDYAATSELSLIHYRFDSSHAGLMRMINFLANLDTPGYLETEMTSKRNTFRGSDDLTIHSAAEAIAAVVRRRSYMRKYVAQWILFEDLSSYDALTLAQLAEYVEREYRDEFGDSAFVSSTRGVASALAGSPGTEREKMLKMLSLALEFGQHIASRLAINWLAQVRLHNASVQKELDRLKETTLKEIWRSQMIRTTADADFLRVLLAGESFEGHQN